MSFSGNKRLRGEFDPVDLIAGLLITLCIPTLTFFVLRNTGVETKGDPARYQKDANKDVVVKTDAELVALKIEHFSKIYNETGKGFLARSLQSKGVQRLNERDWAKSCFTDIINKLVSLENNIKGASLEASLSVEMNSIRLLRERVQLDLNSMKNNG